jgi:hypothetical protein
MRLAIADANNKRGCGRHDPAVPCVARPLHGHSELDAALPSVLPRKSPTQIDRALSTVGLPPPSRAILSA